MIYNTTVTIASTGVAQAVSSTRVPCSWITLQSDENAQNVVYHGPPSVTTTNGQAIATGMGGGPPQYPPIGDTSIYDLKRVYVVGTAGDIVRVQYCVR